MRISVLLLLACVPTTIAAQSLSGGPHVGAARPGKPLPVVQVSPAMVTIGDGVTSKGTFNGSDELPFVQALAALPAGGFIHVGPGVYAFSAPVRVSAPDVHIAGAGATLQSSNDPDVGILDVVADGFCLSGLELREDAPAQDHALVRVTAGHARIADCNFVGGDAGAFEPTFLVFNGREPEVVVEDNRFFPDKGWTGIYAYQTIDLGIIRNTFDGTDAPGMLAMRYAIWTYDTSYGEISGNKFLSIGTATDPLEAVIHSENAFVDSHHWIISDNTFHTVAAKRVMELPGSSFNVISGNSIGRIYGPSLVAAIDIGPNSAEQDPTATTISGNEFHNLTAPAVRINRGDGFLVASNLFTLVNATAIVIGDASGPDDLSIASNVFRASGTIGAQPAIQLISGAGQGVYSNCFYGFAVQAIDVGPGIPPGAVAAYANFEY